MNLAPASPGTEPAAPPRRRLLVMLVVTALASLLLVFHNYGYPVLPRQQFTITPAEMKPYAAERPHLFVYTFDHSEANHAGTDRSSAVLFENGAAYGAAMRDPAEAIVHGGRRWVHQPGRILFASSDNTDPRTNGRTYTIRSPILYSRTVGLTAVILFALSVAGLHRVRRGPPAPPVATPLRWRWHLGLAAFVFLLGLYCNTGTLAPYAITTFPHQAKGTGYLYNPDHVHFRALSDFAQGDERSRWDGGILLHRILFPVLAWPFVRVLGFEYGGTIASLVLNLGAFVWSAVLIRRWIGERGAVLALWLLALYPGAAYWGGLPYPYAMIAPGSLLLLLALTRLGMPARTGMVAALSLAMGIGYLGYDFAPFFLPASLAVLVWQRRFLHAGLAAILQALPVVLWLLVLNRVFGQAAVNSNTASYLEIVSSYLRNPQIVQILARLGDLPEPGLCIFFGASFLFLPGLFLLAVALNPVTSRARLSVAELALLGVVLAVFLVNNLAPAYGGWQLRGTWIARLYQPVYAVFILFLARWWQHLPPLPGLARAGLWAALGACALGNALIVFGPILNNPGRVSETAFYRFYNHSDTHWVYEEYCLKVHGRHPLGFPARKP